MGIVNPFIYPGKGFKTKEKRRIVYSRGFGDSHCTSRNSECRESAASPLLQTYILFSNLLLLVKYFDEGTAPNHIRLYHQMSVKLLVVC